MAKRKIDPSARNNIIIERGYSPPITYRELARRFGVSPTRVFQICNGKKEGGS